MYPWPGWNRNPAARVWGSEGVLARARRTTDNLEETDMNAATLDVQTLAGPFSLIGRGPVKVQAVPGLVVHVRSGALAIRRPYDAREYYVRTGNCFVAERTGTMVLEPLGRAELSLDWPEEDGERLSPGLEPGALPAAPLRRVEPQSALARLRH